MGRLAQLGERLVYTQEVGGSIPSPPIAAELVNLVHAMNEVCVGYPFILIATSYFVTDVRVPGVSPVGIASSAASPTL